MMKKVNSKTRLNVGYFLIFSIFVFMIFIAFASAVYAQEDDVRYKQAESQAIVLTPAHEPIFSKELVMPDVDVPVTRAELLAYTLKNGANPLRNVLIVPLLFLLMIEIFALRYVQVRERTKSVHK